VRTSGRQIGRGSPDRTSDKGPLSVLRTTFERSDDAVHRPWAPQ
jgi:hypothetical protein